MIQRKRQLRIEPTAWSVDRRGILARWPLQSPELHPSRLVLVAIDIDKLTKGLILERWWTALSRESRAKRAGGGFGVGADEVGDGNGELQDGVDVLNERGGDGGAGCDAEAAADAVDTGDQGFGDSTSGGSLVGFIDAD